MDKIQRLIISNLLIATLGCFMAGCKKDSNKDPVEQSKSSKKDILSFEFYKMDNNALITDYNTSSDGNSISATLPTGTNLSALKAAFTVSEKAKVMVNQVLQISRTTENNFSVPVVYTVEAEDGSKKKYTVSVNIR